MGSKVVEQVACLEQQKMPDCMVEQQKQALEQQQQHQAHQQQPLVQQPSTQTQHVQMEQQLMDQCAVAQQQKIEQQKMEQQAMEQQQQLEQQAIALAMEQQQHQQQQGWNNDMSQAAYEAVPTDTNFQSGQQDTSQFYNGQPDGGGKDGGASLGVYTPDSSTNSVHSLHGYPENHENYPVGGGDGGGGDMNTDQAAQYTQDMSGQAGLDNSYTQVETTDPVHNTSV